MKNKQKLRPFLSACCLMFLLLPVILRGQLKVEGLQNISAPVFNSNFAYSSSSFPYDFYNPIYSDLLCDSMLQLGTSCVMDLGHEPVSRYQISVFGPRMTVSSGEIKKVYDFHQGADIVDKKIPTSDPMPDIRCACNGEIVQVQRFNNVVLDNSGQRVSKSCTGTITTTAVSDVEQTEEGQYVKVKCNATFTGTGATGWGNIYMAYRHLSDIDTAVSVGKIVSRGDILGKMGQSGATVNNHLHFSLQKRNCNTDTYQNVHPMRAFNPLKNPHITRLLDNSEIELYLLNHATFRADKFIIVRIAVPYYQANLQYIQIKSGLFYNVAFDFEQRSIIADGSPQNLDDNSLDNKELFVFPFNRTKSAYNFFTDYSQVLPADHTGKKYPIPNSGVFMKSAYVLDIKTNIIPSSSLKSNGLEIQVFDIWGKGVKGTISPQRF